MRRCDCCNKPHQLQSLMLAHPDIGLGDPPPQQGGHVALYCQAYLRRRARLARELEAGRKAYGRTPRKAAA